MDQPELHDVVGSVAALLDHLAPRRMLRRWIFGIDYAAGDLEGELGDSVASLMDHHDLVAFGEGDDVDPVGRIEDEEVVLAAARMRRAAAMEIEDRGAERDVAG